MTAYAIKHKSSGLFYTKKRFVKPTNTPPDSSCWGKVESNLGKTPKLYAKRPSPKQILNLVELIYTHINVEGCDYGSGVTPVTTKIETSIDDWEIVTH